MNSLLLTNSTAQSISAGGAVPLGSAVHGFGKDIVLNGERINLNSAGHYDIEAVLSGIVTTAGTVTLTMYEGAAAVANSTVTTTANNAAVAIPLIWNTFVKCGCNSTNIHFTLSGAMTNASMTVEVKK